MVGDWNLGSAYVVTPPFYYSWLLGDTLSTEDSPRTGPIGIPLMHWIDGSSPQMCNLVKCCATLSTFCVQYQRFSHGYIWQNLFTGVKTAVICPDVAGPNWPDHVVDLLNDILGVIQHYPGGTFPYDPQFDINGDGVIDLLNDILGVISHYQQTCAPKP